MLSDAVVCIATLPDTVEFAVGAVSAIVGRVVSAEPVGFASSIPRSSTVSEPFAPSARPKLTPSVSFGTTGVCHTACLQVEEAGNESLDVQNPKPPSVSRLNAVKETGAVDLYQAVTL